MTLRLLLALIFLAAVCSTRAHAADMALRELIAALRQQGFGILYSDNLVPGHLRVQVAAVDLPALAAALAPLGLQLESRAGVWVISRAPASAETVAPPATVTLPDTILETVIVTGSLHRFPAGATASSSYSFTPDDMTLQPALASDAIRAALRLPGMSSVGVSAKPRIRGGLQDELLVMQDGVELLEPFHLADYHSAYSSIDYLTIESLDVYTGGFPSRYGNRMSGVMDIRNEWADAEYNTDIGVSSFANFIHTRGQLGQQRKADWLLSVRQGDLSDLTEYIETRSGNPKYLDASARMNVQLAPATTLDFGVAYADDDILFRDEEERASSQVDTSYLWAGVDHQFAQRLRSRLTTSWLELERQKLLGSFEDEDKGGLLDHRQQVRRLALRNDWTALYNTTLLEFGWQAEYNRGEYRHISRIDRGELADILETTRDVERDIQLQPRGWSGGAYLQAEWELVPGVTVQPSLRWDMQDYYLEGGAENQFSPRLGLAWDLAEHTQLRLSMGRFYQPEGIQELQVLDGVTEFFRPQYSDQVVVGLEQRGDNWELRGELYYKRYRDQKGRFENIFNPFVLLPEMEPDRVLLQPDKAMARGVDLDAKISFNSEWQGLLRYSYMDATDRVDGVWVDRRWSQQHTVNAGLSWQRDDFSIALAITWHSGWRSSQLPDFVPEDTIIAVSSVLNNVELREYFSLDLSVRKSWEIGRTRLLVYADISNLSDRKNQAGIDFDVEEVDAGYVLLRDRETLLPRIPSMGITLSF